MDKLFLESQFTTAKVATCTLNQWAMDFEWNKNNIIKSIKQAKAQGCTIRLGPELEVTGYSCEDHFLETDTITHSWEVLAEILDSDITNGILCAIGMPVLHNNILFNCAVIVLNKQILLIRPKIYLAEGGNYREPRFFTAWGIHKEMETFELPVVIQQVTKQKSVPFGNAIIQTLDTRIGVETCQELWMPSTLSSILSLNGVEIFLNMSGSHYETNKQKRRLNMILEATIKTGAIYLYSNLRGCDGNRIYFDGASIIAQNGKILSMTNMFALQDIDLVITQVDLDRVRSSRAENKSFGEQALEVKRFPVVHADINIAQVPYNEQVFKELSDEEVQQYIVHDLSYGPSCYLWDYLRRSGANGFFLPLSGGADSASTALIVYNMCCVAFETMKNDETILKTLRQIVKDESFVPTCPKDICKRVLYTGYLGTRNSSQETRDHAQLLSEEINSTHYNVNIEKVFKAFEDIAEETFGKRPEFNKSYAEDIALQNIQSRSRMIMSFLMGQLAPWNKGQNGFLLVLGSANLDEGLRGYLTKYDCSSADINPIGSISKTDVRKLLQWNYEKRNIQAAKKILDLVPTAELKPLNGDKFAQTDEQDMGMTYEELGVYGKWRKNDKLGPVSMFKRAVSSWKHLKPQAIAEKIKHFFKYYALNRHKQTVITPSFHAESYSTDDNRFDLRQFLYNFKWPFQFKRIDKLAQELENNQKQ
ncbi:hypothetical protein ABPG74_018798 [Tetrahymena malaccensis]